MTTPEQVCSEQGIDLVYFDGRGSHNKGLLQPTLQSH